MELFNKIKVPTNADAYNLAADYRALGESANVVIPVSSQTERDGLPATEGMTVCRLDKRYAPLETYAGGAWQVGYTPWATITLASGWGTPQPQAIPRYSRVGQTVYIDGVVQTPTSASNRILTGTALPSWARPDRNVNASQVWNSENVFRSARVTIEPSGAITMDRDTAPGGWMAIHAVYRAGDMGSL